MFLNTFPSSLVRKYILGGWFDTTKDEVHFIFAVALMIVLSHDSLPPSVQAVRELRVSLGVSTTCCEPNAMKP